MNPTAILTIDLAALRANHRLFKEKVGPKCSVAGVVKANAYGTGLLQSTAALYAEGCREFFVATLDEALALRKAHADIRINLLGGLPDVKEMDANRISPVLNTLEEINSWGEREGGIVHFDTGMNRLGLGAADSEKFIASVKNPGGKTIMSHFVSADEAGSPITNDQFVKFDKIAKSLSGARRSLANSSGAFRSATYHYDMVRPGMAVYGLNPTPELANPMKPVVKLEARILQTRTVAKGETCGYNATYTFPEKSTIATLSLGYADGFLRSLSGKGHVYYNGIACTIRGRVSMDLTIIEIGHLAAPPKAGDYVEVLGPNQDADTLADAAGTIGYEILTSLGPRYHRVYTG